MNVSEIVTRHLNESSEISINLTIGEIIAEHLENIEADGLCNSEVPCGCALRDRFPCGGPCGQCVPAWLGESGSDDCDLWYYPSKEKALEAQS